jgi:hypothetical protein
MKGHGIEPPEAKTFLEELSVDLKLGSAGEVLSRNKRLDDLRNSALFMYINQGFQAHRRRKRCETAEDIWECGKVEISRNWIDEHECIRRSWVNHGR